MYYDSLSIYVIFTNENSPTIGLDRLFLKDRKTHRQAEAATRIFGLRRCPKLYPGLYGQFKRGHRIGWNSGYIAQNRMGDSSWGQKEVSLCF